MLIISFCCPGGRYYEIELICVLCRKGSPDGQLLCVICYYVYYVAKDNDENAETKYTQ